MTVSPGFLLLSAWLLYRDVGGLFPATLAFCLCHELGHLAALRLLRVPVRAIRLTALGAEIEIGGGLTYRAELWAALAGPAVNLLLAALLRDPVWSGLNLLLALFNLLPLGRLDGGRAVTCLVNQWGGLAAGEGCARLTARLLLPLLALGGAAVLGLWGNPALLLLGLWLWRRAKREA